MIYQEILPKSILSSRKVYFTMLESYGFNLVSANQYFNQSFSVNDINQQKLLKKQLLLKQKQNKNFQLEAQTQDGVEDMMNKALKHTLYGVLQGQISKIIKYASATKIEIDLFCENNKVNLIVTDNGIGFDVTKIKPGLGLKNIGSRAELMGGKADILTEPGKGCNLTVKIPINL